MSARTPGRARWGDAYQDGDLIFCRENGAPLRPEYVLRRFRLLTAAAGLPRVRVHDLRHLAASMMIAAGVPLAIVSKTLRHSTVSITADVYSHMTADVAREAVDAMAAALDAAEAEARSVRAARDALAEPTGEPGSASRSTVPHSPRTHKGDSIMNGDTGPTTASAGRKRRSGTFRW